eukprot:3670972-Pyramimonas_sp.AAC.2
MSPLKLYGLPSITSGAFAPAAPGELRIPPQRWPNLSRPAVVLGFSKAPNGNKGARGTQAHHIVGGSYRGFSHVKCVPQLF